jgi:hypothetical protein
MKNYGLDVSNIKIEPEHWVTLGSSGVVNRPDSTWESVLYEPQFTSSYDTFGCTVWGTQSQIEIYIKEVFGVEPNYWEQFNYNDVGINPPGENPQKVYDSIHKKGMMNQLDRTLPSTLEEFKTPRPPSKEHYDEAKKWPFTLNHWWLADTSKESIIENLKRCPVAVSVTAWRMEDGVYVDDGMANTHWCVAIAPSEYKGRKTIKVFDSYDHSEKILHPDHRIQFAKTITVNPKVTEDEHGIIANVFTTLLNNGLVSGFISWWKKFVTREVIPVEVITQPEPKMTPQDWLKEAIKAADGLELAEKAPQELACAEVASKLLQIVHPDFPMFLHTGAMFNHLKKDKRFKGTLDIGKWQIIISPTGWGNGSIPNGHIGFISENGLIYSNDSRSGKFVQNFTIGSWVDYYRVKGGYPVFIFDLV